MKLSANSLMRDSVKNKQGENLGDIKELMIDTSTGKVSYAVLDFGGFLGVGNKLFAVPWSAITVNTEKHEMMVDVSKETLKEAKGFDQDNWPNFQDRHFEKQIHTVFGAKPYWD